MANLTETQNKQIKTEVASWVEKEFNPKAGDSSPLHGMLGKAISTFKKSIKELPEEEQARKLNEQKDKITKQLQAQIVAGAEKGGRAKDIENNLTQSKALSETDEQVNIFKRIIDFGGTFLGDIGQFLVGLVTNMPFFGEAIGDMLDGRDKTIKDAEKAAAGAASGIKIVSIGNDNITADASTRYTVMQNINGLLSKTNEPEAPAPQTISQALLDTLEKLDGTKDGKIDFAKIAKGDSIISKEEHGLSDDLLAQFKNFAQANKIVVNDDGSFGNANTALPTNISVVAPAK